MISLWTSRIGISGHHVEGEPVAIVNSDAVAVPGFTVEPERALAGEWVQQTVANGDGHRSVEHAAEGIEPLDIAIKDGRNPLSQHHASSVEVVGEAIVEAGGDGCIHRRQRFTEARHRQAVSLITARGRVQMW